MESMVSGGKDTISSKDVAGWAKLTDTAEASGAGVGVGVAVNVGSGVGVSAGVGVGVGEPVLGGLEVQPTKAKVIRQDRTNASSGFF